jgi:hypothetical protein
MHYEVKGILIRSENAAKPDSDVARPLVQWLRERDETPSALDYGCGKLRYTEHMALRSAKIGICDSRIQLTRKQVVHGKHTSVQDYSKQRWPNCKIHILEEFLLNQTCKYHFVLCSNVLSTIPNRRIRSRSLQAIRGAMVIGGQVLFVNQHTNSYFTLIQHKPSTRPYLDGWISEANGRFSYYGVLNKDMTVRLATKHGFNIVDAWIDGQSNYVLAKVLK